MPNNKYVSEGAERRFDNVIPMPQAEEGGITFEPGQVAKGNPGVTNDLKKFASDQASYTGPEEGFFAKFGSNEVSK